jgi:hypothetical protein
MDLEQLLPFLKVAGIVLGLAVLGILGTCAFGRSAHPCHALPMDKINTCLDRAKKCGGTEAEAEACVAKAVAESR